MAAPEKSRDQKFNAAAEPQLSTGVGGGPPGGGRGGNGGRVANGPPPHDPSLTEKFNQAAIGPPKGGNKPISSKVQIEMLKQKMSQPRMNCSFSPKGTVTNSINVKRDQKIRATIKEMEANMKAKQGAHKEFSRVAKAGTLTQKYNKASIGMKR